MEMTVESLVAAGFTQEQATQIIAAHKAALAGQYVPKSRFDEVSQQVKDRDQQITELGKFKGTAEELQTKVTELEAKNQQQAQEAAAALIAERKRNALVSQLTGKVHDVDLVLSQIDQEKVSVAENGTVIGFEDQLKALKETKGFLFVEKAPADQQQQSEQGTSWEQMLSGIRLQGKIPPEGGETKPDPKKPADVAFGEALAQQMLAAQKQVANGTEHYFKI